MNFSCNSEPPHRRILELTELADGFVRFTIDERTTGLDVEATLHYVHDDAINIHECWRTMVATAVEHRGGAI